MLRTVYFDNNATTPLLPGVKSGVGAFLETGFGNPSSIHWAGRKPKQVLRESRQKIAQFLQVHPLEIIFMSGASEANNTLLQGLIRMSQTESFQSLYGEKSKIISSNMEHPSIMKTLDFYSNRGDIQWVKIDFDLNGAWDKKKYLKELDDQTLLVTCMSANNETGFIPPLKEMASLARGKNILFHSDMTQSLGKMEISLSYLDYVSFSGHKLYALKGVGGLWVRKGAPFENLIWGGSQERFRRSGTENILAIHSLGLAIDELNNHSGKESYLLELRDYFETEVSQKINNLVITHKDQKRLPNTSHLVIEGVDGESLLMALDLKGFAVSTGAACSSGSSEPSPVLINLGMSLIEAQSSLRVSFGLHNKKSEIIEFIDELVQIVNRLRKLKT